MTDSTRKQLILWLSAGCLLIATMVVIGGITRLSGSGLSITKWDVVTGITPPLTDEGWQKEFSQYQQTPQYKEINSHFNISDYKSIYWWEYIHRLLARFVGLYFLFPTLYFYFRRKITGKQALDYLGTFLLILLQGFLGWWMVASGLVDKPHVSHYNLASHLILAFITFSYVMWLCLSLVHNNIPSQKEKTGLKIWAFLLYDFTLVQVIYGAFMAGKNAGIGYNTWPKMGDKWVADGMDLLTPAWKNLLDNPVAIQFIHRTLALAIIILVSIIWFKTKGKNLNRSQHFSILLLQLAVGLQFTLGILTLVYTVPFSLAVLHQFGALLFLSSVTFFAHRIYKS